MKILERSFSQFLVVILQKKKRKKSDLKISLFVLFLSNKHIAVYMHKGWKYLFTRKRIIKRELIAKNNDFVKSL